MPSLADASTRAAITARIAQLSPDTAPVWGRMSAPQMLAHCADALRMAYGDLPCAPKRVPLAQLGIVKWLMFNVIPFPKGAPTARELIDRAPAAWGVERGEVVSLVERFGRETSRTAWPAHPLFGPLTGAEWGQLAWKHLDHHLRQFRV
jgi:hypothetical protein